MLERFRSMWGQQKTSDRAQDGGEQHHTPVRRGMPVCAVAGLALLLGACGTTVDLTGSAEAPAAPRSVRAVELTSSQQSLRLLSEQVTNTPWTARAASDDMVGLFASVLVNGVKATDETSGAPQDSQAAVYLDEIAQDHATLDARLAAVRADLAAKVAQSEAFARAVDRVLTEYRLGAVAGTGQAGDVYRADLAHAALLQEDVLAQARRDVHLVTKGFDALDSQRTVFSEALARLNADAEDAGVSGLLSANVPGAEGLLRGLDHSLVDIAALGASFDTLVTNSEAVVASVVQPVIVQP